MIPFVVISRTNKLLFVALEDLVDVSPPIYECGSRFSAPSQEQLVEFVPLRLYAALLQDDILQEKLAGECRADCSWNRQHLDTVLVLAAIKASVGRFQKAIRFREQIAFWVSPQLGHASDKAARPFATEIEGAEVDDPGRAIMLFV
ncbi:MAG: hypothetical protein ABIR36_11035 [Nitrospiraceae bacterium]